MSSERRLRELGIDPDGDPGEIAREVKRLYRALRAKDENGGPKFEAADVPVIVDNVQQTCHGNDAATRAGSTES